MESELIAWLRKRLPRHPQLTLGLGDDAAILRLAERAECVVTTDLLTDDIDFRLADADPRRVGRKALAVNLSDLAAMAARPLAAVVALAVPRDCDQQFVVDLYEGMLPLAEKYNLVIAGGDTNCWDGPFAINITAIGEVTEHGPLRRSGAQPGDQIVVTGSFGGSILGRHFDFEPRVDQALLLNANYELHAGIDVSDGLSLDVSRLAAESGCGAVLDTRAIPISVEAREIITSSQDSRAALGHALGDGEDFELALAVPPEEAARLLDEQPLDIPLTRIGEFISQPGLWERAADGCHRPLEPQGYEHWLRQ